MIKKYVLNKIVVYTLILLLLGIFYYFPSNKEFEIDVSNENKKELYDHIVYLLDNDNYLSKVTSYYDKNSINDVIKYKIDVLINGSKDLNEFYSLIPKGTILKDFKIDKDSLYLNFSKEILNVNEYLEESMIQAIVYSLTEINGINNIFINVEGKVLDSLPNSKKELIYPLTRNIGINKKYDIDSLKNLKKTTVFFAKEYNGYNYYVPITRVDNSQVDKIDIILHELKSSVNSQDNLNSYISNKVELVSSNIDENKMNLVFNEYIFSDIEKGVILEEVKYVISQSIFENYNVDEVIFKSSKDKNITSIVKK